MLELFYFVFEQIFNFFIFLDSVTIFGSISFLKLVIILGLIYIAFKFLHNRKGD